MYWDKHHDDLILEYLDSDSHSRKNRIFIELEPVLLMLVDGVFQFVEKKYGFFANIDRETLKSEAFLNLIEKLPKYTDRTNRPFSYYQTIVKNYFLGKKIVSDSKLRQKVELTELNSNIEISDQDNYSVFLELKIEIIHKIEEYLIKTNLDDEIKRISYLMIHMLKNWDHFEFRTPREFKRELKVLSNAKDQKINKAFKIFQECYKQIKK